MRLGDGGEHAELGTEVDGRDTRSSGHRNDCPRTASYSPDDHDSRVVGSEET